MDPDETLRMARKAAMRLQEALNSEDEFVMNYSPRAKSVEEQAQELLDCFQALNDWLSKGGCLPAAWAKGRK